MMLYKQTNTERWNIQCIVLEDSKTGFTQTTFTLCNTYRTLSRHPHGGSRGAGRKLCCRQYRPHCYRNETALVYKRRTARSLRDKKTCFNFICIQSFNALAHCFNKGRLNFSRLKNVKEKRWRGAPSPFTAESKTR